MTKYKEPRQITEEEFEKEQMQKWLADSHYWIEENNTMQCKWCGKHTTTTLEGDATLCLENPVIANQFK